VHRITVLCPSVDFGVRLSSVTILCMKLHSVLEIAFFPRPAKSDAGLRILTVQSAHPGNSWDPCFPRRKLHSCTFTCKRFCRTFGLYFLIALYMLVSKKVSNFVIICYYCYYIHGKPGGHALLALMNNWTRGAASRLTIVQSATPHIRSV